MYTLSVHHERELLIWNAIQSRIERDATLLTAAELQYMEALKPTDFLRKATALIVADILVVAITWISPLVHRHDGNPR